MLLVVLIRVVVVSLLEGKGIPRLFISNEDMNHEYSMNERPLNGCYHLITLTVSSFIIVNPSQQ